MTVLHPVELFEPVSVDPFLATARLEQRTSAGTWAASDVRSTPLPTTDPIGCSSSGGALCWRLDQPACTPATGVASLECYRGLEGSQARARVVYGAVFRTRDRLALQYWYWYSYDFWSGTRPATDYVWQAHEGDWEVVTVLLDARAKPLLAGYSQHNCGKRREWSKVPKWPGTSHPLVYVALGSHANYFAPRVNYIDLRRQCYPPAGATILRYLLSEVLEYTGRGARFGPPLRGVAPAKLVRVTAVSPQWMSFPGYWGEDNLFHVSGPLGTQVAGPGPAGPAFHAIWRDPIRTVLGWPRG